MQALYRSALGAVMAASMVTASTAAAAAPAPQAPTRAPAEVAQGEDLVGTAWIIAGAALLAIILLIVLLDDGDNDNLPASP